VLLAVLGLTARRQADRFTRDIEFLRNHRRTRRSWKPGISSLARSSPSS
jgi:hypothetical protein